MEHVLFIQKVKRNKKAEYLEANRNTPPEVLKAIRKSGIQREIKWLDGDLLFIYVMANGFGGAMAAQGESEVFERWVQKLWPLLSEIQDYSKKGKIKRLTKVFDLEEQLRRVPEDGE